MPSPSGGLFATLSDGDATPWRQAGVGRASEVEGQPRGAGYRGAGGDLLLHLPHLVRVLVSPHPPVSFRAPLEQPQAARGGVLAPLHVGLQALQRRLVLHGPRRGPLLLVGQHQSVLAPPLLRGLLWPACDLPPACPPCALPPAVAAVRPLPRAAPPPPPLPPRAAPAAPRTPARTLLPPRAPPPAPPPRRARPLPRGGVRPAWPCGPRPPPRAL